MSKKIFIIAGENSGDLHASNLVRSIKSINSEYEFFGLGGDQLEKAGTRLLANIVQKLAIIGFVEIVRNIKRLKDLFNRVDTVLREDKPDAVILIDYPGFNIRVARMAKALNIPVIYYISPQVWAWRKKRIFEIAKVVDKMLVILPFEEELYKNVGVDVEYVGHPLFDVMKITMDKNTICERFNIDPNKKIIGLLPGSRKKEIVALLSPMLEAAEMIKQKLPEVQFVIPRATTVSRGLVNKLVDQCSLEVKVVNELRYNVRSTFDFAIVASGTATLETAFLLCPMVIVYKVSFITWLIAKNLVDLPYIGLVNVVADELIVPELLQDEVTAQNISRIALKVLTNPKETTRIKHELKKIKDKMGGPGASEKAASIIVNFLENKK